jgi:PAS domain S-box-containing protein
MSTNPSDANAASANAATPGRPAAPHGDGARSHAARRKVAPLHGTLLFLVLLSAFLFVAGYSSAHLLQLENKRKSHELSTKLIAQQIKVTLQERIQMAKRLARNPTIIQMYDRPLNNLDTRALLNTVNEMADTALIYTLDPTGRTFASADSQEALLVGKNYNFRPYFHQAMRGEIALYPAVGAFTHKRGIHIAVPIIKSADEPPKGVLVMKIDMMEIEDIFNTREEALAMVSPDGVILSTNRPDWMLHSLRILPPETQESLASTRQFALDVIEPLPINLTGNRVRLDRDTYNIVREPLFIPGWSILSCQRDRPLDPLPSLQRFLWELGLAVTGGLATLIFFLGANVLHRKRTEQMLRRTEEKYRSIFENAVMGVYQSTPEGRFFEASPSMARILGYDSPTDLIDAVQDMRDIYVDPRDRDVWLQLLNEKREFSGFETRYLKKNGEPIWVSLSCRLARDPDRSEQFLEGFCLDVTEKKEAVEALRRERDILSRIMATSPASIVLCDMDGNVSFANPHAEQLLDIHPLLESPWGYSRPRYDVCTLDGEPMAPEDTPTARALSRRRITRNDRCMLRWPDGREVLVSVSIAPMFDAEGRVAEMVFVYEDITKMVRTEKEAAEQQQQLFEADRMIAMGILTSGVAHEINNPNTYILSSAQTLSDVWREAAVVLDEYYEENGDFVMGGIPYSTLRDMLPSLNGRILDGSRRIGRIVKELLVFSRRESIGTTETVDVNRVLRTSEILLSSMIKKCTHHFEMVLQEDELLIQGNFQRLEQVLINIIQNACQALPDPDRSIRVTSHTDVARSLAVVEVVDQGVGIAEENIARVMDPFFTTKRETGGTGLGLAVSSTIVHDLGGTMNFLSAEGRGTTVTLSFPLKKDAHQGTHHGAN